ncbi:hypothetical protein B296_00027162 [Ensete ventricosum]|uniref:FAD/NAD(P)-binding domain-containing protein n=1 Tax=Ensete ventricosum TaxID=4639 RepID=A0A426ZCT6_ENSVE|nr:hypothetical protein B296_00027162 [Ensete ventricosum]
MLLSRIAKTALSQSSQAARIAAGNHYMGMLREGFPAAPTYHTWLRDITASGNGERSSLLRPADVFRVHGRGIGHSPHFQHPSAEAVEDDLYSGADDARVPGLEPTKAGEKPRVVVLGTGWAGCRFLKGLDTKLYDIVCISPRNHMVFTPLLASTCVGTLEFRSVAEPVSRIQAALSGAPNSYFYLASCTGIDARKHQLVIAAGADPLTFNIRGVKEHAMFLREVQHAQEIRRKLLLNLMLSEAPEEEKKRLLHCVVIGGGPTGVEFSGELERCTPKSGVRFVRGVVKEVLPEKILLSDGTCVPYGLLVWSTGVGPSEFVKSLDLPKSPGGRIGVDEWFRVPSVEDVFALGDFAGFLEQTGRPVLPALAQVSFLGLLFAPQTK